MHKLDKKVAVVTGAANGIGAATVAHLVEKDFIVVMADLPGDALERAVAHHQKRGESIIAVPGDVSDYTGVQASAQDIIDKYGSIDVLVNNAGISQPKPFLDLTEAEWDRTLNVNLKGVFNWCKACAPQMLRQKDGRIVNISSVSAHTGGAKSAVSKSAYCASKAGVLGLTRGLAKELAPWVMVNAICPGAIMTNLTQTLFEQNEGAVRSSIPLGRIGTPEDIAVVVEFLATMSPCFMTGEVVDVDGGQWVN